MRCCHHKFVHPSFLSWINGNRRFVPTHALSHMLPPHPLIGWGALAPQRRERWVSSGNITPLRIAHYVDPHTVPPIADGEKEKWTLLPIGSLAYVPAPTGASLSLLSPPPSFPRPYGN